MIYIWYNICTTWFLDIRISTCLGSYRFSYQSLLLSTIVIYYYCSHAERTEKCGKPNKVPTTPSPVTVAGKV